MAYWLASVNEWGIPSWENPIFYGEVEEWDMSRWKWEFLRRRDDYRTEFERALEELDSPATDPVDISPFQMSLLERARSLPFSHLRARKYDLTEFYDPVISDWGFGPEWNSGLSFGGLEGVDYERDHHGNVEKVPAPNLAALTFDLSRNIKAQMKEAQIELLDWQQDYFRTHGGEAPKSKRHPTKWLMYLRLLDAEAEGASLNDMVPILSETLSRRDARAVGNVLKQAKDLSFRF